jgi:hypothetical protein
MTRRPRPRSAGHNQQKWQSQPNRQYRQMPQNRKIRHQPERGGRP